MTSTPSMREFASTASPLARGARKASIALAASGLFVTALVVQTGTALAANAESAIPAPPAAALRTAKLAPNRQAQLVDTEDTRLDDVRTGLSKALTSPDGSQAPFRVASGGSITQVLTGRQKPYTLDELLTLTPKTLVRLPDQTYLLRENLVVAPGATLELGGTAPVTLRLISQSTSFASIVSLGGRLQFGGTAVAPVRIQSWDPKRSAPDQSLSDGRAYVRAYGGSVLFDHLIAADLGFWSGRTGGLAITGTNQPQGGSASSGATDAKAQALAARTAYKAALAKYKAAVKASKAAVKQGLPALAVPPLPTFTNTPEAAPTAKADTSAVVTNSTFTGNAFGIFVSNTSGFVLRDSTAEASIADGVNLHQFVQNAVVERVTARGNAANGFSLSRGVQGITLRDDTAAGNAQDGFRISGRALGSGAPSAGLSSAGLSSAAFGDIHLIGGSATTNGQVGVEILDGRNETVQGMVLRSNPEGIVFRNNATDGVISGNTITGSRIDAIALRTGSVAKVTGNKIDGSASGIVVRDAVGTLDANKVAGASQHAVSFAGAVARSSATNNTLSGKGSAAIYFTGGAHRANITLANNHSEGWLTVHKGQSWIRQLLHPMNILWALLVVVALLGRIRARRQLRNVRSSHPYAATQPLVSTADVPGPRKPLASENGADDDVMGPVSLTKTDP